MVAQPTTVEVRVNKLAANLVGSLLAVVLCAAAIVLAIFLPHHKPVTIGNACLVLVVLLVVMPLHEWLHGAGFMYFGGVRRSQIKFGMHWKALMPYCYCGVPVSLRVYRRMALLPLWVTGMITIVLLFIHPTELMGMLVGVTIAACVGDVWMFLKLRKFSDDRLTVVDSATEIGFDVQLIDQTSGQLATNCAVNCR